MISYCFNNQEPSNVYFIQEKFRVHVYPGKNQKNGNTSFCFDKKNIVSLSLYGISVYKHMIKQ